MTLHNMNSTAAIPCELISWKRFNELAQSLTYQLRESGERIDVIVAIARGGYMPARILSDMLGVMNLTTFKVEHYHGTRKSNKAFIRYPLAAELDGQSVLLVDDVSDSGDTFHVAMEHVFSLGTPARVKTAVLHYKSVSTFVPDFYAAVVNEWRWIIYPWAVTEDLAALISELYAETNDAETIQVKLKESHGIEPAKRQIKDALALLSSQ